ncbi:MAG: permease [Microgenomates group bacterium]
MDIFYPIGQFADIVTYQWMRIMPQSYLGNAVNFFVYDLIKISVMLIIINYVMAISRYYFPMEKVRDILTKRRWYGLDYLFAALLGMITPFCSCSSIPLFIGFLSAGIPLGVTFAFLISSPLINESSLYLFPAIFGFKTTLIYNLVGISISMLGGMIIQKLNMEKYVRPEFLKFTSKKEIEAKYKSAMVPFTDLVKHWSGEAIDITKRIFPYIIIGVGIGALIHGFVPATLIEHYLASRDWWAVPVATLLGLPLYANSVSVIPIMEALVGKGIPMGTVLAFMTATVTLSIPEALILKKVMKLPLLLTFFGITTVGIMLIGWIFNWV